MCQCAAKNGGGVPFVSADAWGSRPRQEGVHPARGGSLAAAADRERAGRVIAPVLGLACPWSWAGRPGRVRTTRRRDPDDGSWGRASSCGRSSDRREQSRACNQDERMPWCQPRWKCSGRGARASARGRPAERAKPALIRPALPRETPILILRRCRAQRPLAAAKNHQWPLMPLAAGRRRQLE